MRASRVRKPARLSGSRRFGSAATSARAIRGRTAPAWPLGPPPWTRTRTSKVPSTSATFSGDIASSRCVRRGKYCSTVLPLNQVAPSPGRRITRATEVLRLPVPRYWAVSTVDTLRVLSNENFGILGGVRVVRSRIHLQLRQLLTGEPVAREHPLARLADDLGRTALELVAKRAAPEPAGVAGVSVVELVVELRPRHRDLLGVHNDDEVARVDMRRVLRLALAPQRVGDLGRQPTERLALGVKQVQASPGLAWLCVQSLLLV